ncbi:MAG TPA: alpha/beta hydrolase [Burkholderiales bacterium]|nr:alpha/beta hydrolase [Burkholderiales bacterium]
MFAYTAGHAFDKAKPTMVFVHGAGLDHSSFLLQSRYFGYHGWNVLAFDLPGHGHSPGAPISSVAGMAEEVCKAVPAEKFSIVGHSMGSLVALECAARVPSRIERIALIGAAYPMKVGEAFLDAAKRDHYDAFDMHTIWGHAAQVPLGGDPTPGMWMYGDTQARLERLAPGVLYNDLKACNDYVFEGEIACPTLFILGERDVMTPPRSAKAIQEKISGAKTVRVKFSGHSLMTEAPDATLDALVDFFRT